LPTEKEREKQFTTRKNTMKKQASLASYFGAAPKRATDKAPAASDKPSDDAGAAQVRVVVFLL
jgi:hypothetical protein